MRTPRVHFSLPLLPLKIQLFRLALCGATGLSPLLTRGAGDPGGQAPVVVRSAPATSPDELALGLRSAVKMALAKNNAIRVERYAPAIADAQITQQLGAFDPLVVAHGQVSENDSPEFVHTRKGKTELEHDRSVDEPFSVNVRELTPWGGVVTAGTTTESYYNRYTAPRQIYRSFTGVSVTQPLLSGFGADATLTPIRLARQNRDSSVWDFHQTVINTVTQTLEAYADLYFARESLKVSEHSRDLGQQLLDDDLRRVQLGTLTGLDVSVARSQLAVRQEAIINARETAREAENALKLCVSDDVERFLLIHLNIAPPEERECGPLDFNADLPHAYAFRPDYQQVLIGLKERQINLVFDRNHALPQLDLLASFGSNGLDQGMGRSLAQTFHGDYLGASVGVNLQFPLLNLTGKGNVAAAKLQVAQELIAMKQLEQQIVVALDNALGEVRDGRARIEASKNALQLAQDSLDAEQKKLAQGRSTTYTVLQMQDLLSNAQNDLLRAHTTYQKALAEYERQSGRTLERNAVELVE